MIQAPLWTLVVAHEARGLFVRTEIVGSYSLCAAWAEIELIKAARVTSPVDARDPGPVAHIVRTRGTYRHRPESP